MNKKLKLKVVLEKHALWLRNDPNGIRANLRDADLYRADLYGANLYGADLRGADLRGADLYGANLYGADLYGADLRGADLRGANLYGADLRGADLCEANLLWADLYGANFYGADLRGAKNVNYPLACPEKGSFTGFKKVRGNYIVELEILAGAMRSSATGRKCRCSKAKVVSITNPDGSNAKETSVCSGWDPNFIYSVGEVVEVKDFDTNRWNECAPGIHFFITRQEAVDYIL